MAGIPVLQKSHFGKKWSYEVLTRQRRYMDKTESDQPAESLIWPSLSACIIFEHRRIHERTDILQRYFSSLMIQWLFFMLQIILTTLFFNTLWVNSVDNNLTVFSYTSQKIGLDSSCKLSPKGLFLTNLIYFSD